MTVISEKPELKELSVTEVIRKNQLFEAYLGYWKDNLPLKPHLPLDNDLQEILEEAAEVVTRLNYYSDSLNKDCLYPMRILDGKANQFLIQTEKTTENRKAFLKDLVSSTITDSSYTEEALESFIEEFLTYKTQKQEEGKSLSAFNTYSKDHLYFILSSTESLAKEVFENEEERDQKEDRFFLKNFITKLSNMYLDLDKYRTNSKFVYNNSDTSDSETPIDDTESLTSEDNQEQTTDDENKGEEKLEDATPQSTPESTDPKGDSPVDNNNESNDNSNNIETEDANNNNNSSNNTEEENTNSVEGETTSSKPNLRVSNSNIDLRASGMIKIAKVESNIDNTVNEITTLKTKVTELDTQINGMIGEEKNYYAITDPKVTLKNVEELIRQILYWGEALMRDLLTLDGISSGGKSGDEIRAKRKKQAVEIQSLLDELDEIKKPLKSHQSILIKIVDAIRELEEKAKAEVEAKLKQEAEALERAKAKAKAASVKAKAKHQPSVVTEIVEVDDSGKSVGPVEPIHHFPHGGNPEDALKAEEKKQKQQRVGGGDDVEEEEEIMDNDDVPRKINVNEEEEEEDEDYELDEKVRENRALYRTLLEQWRLLKLEPSFETDRQRGRFVISARMPGMKEEDFNLKINERESNLTISGSRLPSYEEFTEIQNALLRRYRFRSASEFSKHLFRYGINRFGFFTASFSLPNNVITSKIQAKYDNGIIYLIVPYRVQKQPENPFFHRNYRPSYSPTNFYSPNNFFY